MRVGKALLLLVLLFGMEVIRGDPGSAREALNLNIGEKPPALLSQNTLFRDDFDRRLRPGWTWQNQESSTWRILDDGWLQIMAGESNVLEGERQTNLLWIALPRGNFEVSVHLKSEPAADPQRAGLLLYEDADHYISLSRGYCTGCVLGGNGIFLEYRLHGQDGRYAAATEASDVYLRLLSEQGAASAFYAIEAGEWRHLASIPNDTVFRRGALNVTNGHAGEQGFSLVATFDYFEISRSIPKDPTPMHWPLVREEGCESEWGS